MIEIALGVFLLLQVLDVWSTLRCLRKGYTEANPIVRWMMNNLGDKGWIIGKLGLAGVAAVLMWPYEVGYWILNAVYLFVVVRNVKIAG